MGKIGAELSLELYLYHTHSASLFLLMATLSKGINAKHNVLRASLALARALCGR